MHNVLSNIVFHNADGHRPSMLQDSKTRRKTEIDFRSGAFIDLAMSVGLKTVRHQGTRQMIKVCDTSKAFAR